LVRQKNLSLLSRIIQNAPQYDFHIWGEASDVDIMNEFTAETSRCSTNTFIHGGFKSFNDIGIDDIDVFLYTSLWDGLPNVILEAAAAGLPVVASDVGGIGELVTTETGWLIDSTVDPDPYIAALHSITIDRDNCEKRVLAMQQKLRCDHNWEKYTEILKTCPKDPGGALW
jgi:glycosyltransferase involved in cell wall biosynthesis